MVFPCFPVTTQIIAFVDVVCSCTSSVVQFQIYVVCSTGQSGWSKPWQHNFMPKSGQDHLAWHLAVVLLDNSLETWLVNTSWEVTNNRRKWPRGPQPICCKHLSILAALEKGRMCLMLFFVRSSLTLLCFLKKRTVPVSETFHRRFPTGRRWLSPAFTTSFRNGFTTMKQPTKYICTREKELCVINQLLVALLYCTAWDAFPKDAQSHLSTLILKSVCARTKRRRCPSNMSRAVQRKKSGQRSWDGKSAKSCQHFHTMTEANEQSQHRYGQGYYIPVKDAAELSCWGFNSLLSPRARLLQSHSNGSTFHHALDLSTIFWRNWENHLQLHFDLECRFSTRRNSW